MSPRHSPCTKYVMSSSMQGSSVLSISARFLEDHRRLEGLVSEIVETVASGDRQRIAALWDVFDAGLNAHLDAEEKYMIPLLMRDSERDGRALLEEHKLLRARLAQLDTAVDLHLVRLSAVKEFIDELQAHAAHEEALLYSLSDRMLDEPKRVSILELLGKAAVL
jgi:hemerythrin superfamily protein